MPPIFRYLDRQASCLGRRVKEGFPEGSSGYPGISPLSTEGQSPKLSCAEVLLHTVSHIFWKAFRAVCEVLIDPGKIPTAFLTLSWHACAGVTAGLQYRCLAAAELEGAGHRTVQHFCSQAHVLGQNLLHKGDRLLQPHLPSSFSPRSFARNKNAQWMCYIRQIATAELAKHTWQTPFGLPLD